MFFEKGDSPPLKKQIKTKTKTKDARFLITFLSLNSSNSFNKCFKFFNVVNCSFSALTLMCLQGDSHCWH